MGIFGALAIMDIIIGLFILFLLKIIGSNIKTKKTTEEKISEDTNDFNPFN